MKILLIKSGIEYSRATGITPPLGLMYIASFVNQQNNHDIRIFDTRFYKNYLKNIQTLIKEFSPDVVGISALTLEAPRMFQIANIIKSRYTDIPIIVGGPHATSAPEEVISNYDIDIAVIGEGEGTFTEVLDALSGIRVLNGINGICFRNNNTILLPFIEANHVLINKNSFNAYADNNVVAVNDKATTNIVKTKGRAYIENLDALPFPAWNTIELDKYASHASMSNVGIRPYMVMFTSRGCPFHCTYCHNIFGKKFRARSVENVIREMEILITRYRINDFEIIDDISNFDKERLKAICNEIIRKDLKVRLSFPNGVRTDLLDEETIHLLKKAGTAEISIAVETASPRLQKLIKKNLNLEKVKHIINIAANDRIFLRGFFMFGFPTETVDELKATIDFACKSKLHIALFFILNPFKDTEIISQIIHSGRKLDDIHLGDFDYMAMPLNISDIPDKKFHMLYTQAYLRFYANPIRILRILRDKPVRNDLFMRFKGLLKNYLPAPRGNKKL